MSDLVCPHCAARFDAASVAGLERFTCARCRREIELEVRARPRRSPVVVPLPDRDAVAPPERAPVPVSRPAARAARAERRDDVETAPVPVATKSRPVRSVPKSFARPAPRPAPVTRTAPAPRAVARPAPKGDGTARRLLVLAAVAVLSLLTGVAVVVATRG